MADTELAGFIELSASHDALRTTALATAEAERLPCEARRELQERLRLAWKSFARRVRTYFPLTYWPRVVPLVPQARGEPWDFWCGVSTVTWLWRKMIAEGADPAQFPWADPAALPLAEMEAETVTFRLALGEAMRLDCATFLARLDLDGAEAELAALLIAYPAAVRSRLPADHRLHASIPQIWPPTRRPRG